MQPTRLSETTARDDAIRRLLSRGGLIDITTTGRRTGKPRRLEIVFHNIDGRIVITGTPRADRTRAWLLNLAADPHITVHLKSTLDADLAGTARIITDAAERRGIAEWIVRHAWPRMDVEAMTAHSPMIEVTLEDTAA
jgi:deazaflavin-dependent oxidoreductase (nitroreductase family)